MVPTTFSDNKTYNYSSETNKAWRTNMTYVVTDNCINCKYTECVEVCPVNCFHEGPNFSVTDPEKCIDCGVCVPVCPSDAIYAEEDIPSNMGNFIAINADLSHKWPQILKKKHHFLWRMTGFSKQIKSFFWSADNT